MDRKEELIKKFNALAEKAEVKTYEKSFVIGNKRFPAGTQVMWIGAYGNKFYKLPGSDHWCIETAGSLRSVNDILQYVAEPNGRLLSCVKNACKKMSNLLEPKEKEPKTEHICEFKVGDTVLSSYDPHCESLSGNTIYFWTVKKINKASIVLDPLGIECDKDDLAAVKDWQEWCIYVKPTSLENSHDDAMIHPAEETTTFRYRPNRKAYVYDEYGTVEKYRDDEKYYASRQYG
jgi:hypothetical protein